MNHKTHDHTNHTKAKAVSDLTVIVPSGLLCTMSTIHRALAVIPLLILSAAALNAQVEKRVVFPKGKSAATLRGNLPRNYADYDAYVIRARKGQTLSVKLTTSDPNAYITVYETKQLGPDEDMISAGEDYPRTWSGKLPITSEYSVQVYGARNIDDRSTRAAYSIEIALK